MRYSIVASCMVVGSVGALGCGGGSSSVDTTSAAGLCPTVLAAQTRYLEATGAMGLQFENLPLESRARKALETFLRRVEQLAPLTSASQQRQLTPFIAALSNQLKTFEAMEQHDLERANKYGNQVNAPLRRGLADLRTICSQQD